MSRCTQRRRVLVPFRYPPRQPSSPVDTISKVDRNRICEVSDPEFGGSYRRRLSSARSHRRAFDDAWSTLRGQVEKGRCFSPDRGRLRPGHARRQRVPSLGILNLSWNLQPSPNLALSRPARPLDPSRARPVHPMSSPIPSLRRFRVGALLSGVAALLVHCSWVLLNGSSVVYRLWTVVGTSLRPRLLSSRDGSVERSAS